MSTNYFIRLEARTRGASLEPGVAARIYDPAWMLARQWQLGELSGDDAGTPIDTELQAETALVTQWRAAGSSTFSPYDAATLPLEALVEAEPLRESTWTVRMRVDAGREFLQALRDGGADAWTAAYLTEYGLQPSTDEQRTIDPPGARLLDIAAGRLPDGEALYRAWTAALAKDHVPIDQRIALQDIDSVRGAGRAWLSWCSACLFESDANTWNSERLEYGFALATGDDAHASVLDATEYRGGRLDWHAFNIQPVAKPSGFRPLDRIDVLPTTVRFRGMPNARWWEFEDASVDMGSVDAGASDTARLALLEFALVYGNDFFAVPLQLPVASLTRIQSLVVTDTFGMKLSVESATRGPQRVGASRWTMFTLAQRAPGSTDAALPADLLFLPSNAGPMLASDVIEDVLLARDEMANLAWAIERSYEGDAGSANQRAESAIRQIPESGPPSGDAAIRYRFGTSVPPHWFPLMLVTNGGQRRFDLQTMEDQRNNPQAVPKGRFLDLDHPAIYEEEVPREGVRLSRDYVMTRWTDGNTLVWSRRRTRVGKGEGSSGLRFDVTEPRA